MKKVLIWLRLARAPFLLVGIMPYILGSVIAFRISQVFNVQVFLLGLCGVILIMIATYFAGEYWDFKEDSISSSLGKTVFAGGSQVIQEGLVTRRSVFLASLIILAAALGVGLLLQFVYQTGVWTLFFGAVGVIGGFFYSSDPVRWVKRGWGEAWIALCYGWLPIAVGYYIMTGGIVPVVHWLAIPVGLTIFNVIILNEFLDQEADRSTGKRNLLVRIGPFWTSRIYMLANIISCLVSLYLFTNVIPFSGLYIYLLILIISISLVIMIAMDLWRKRNILNKMCAGTIIVNLGTTLSFIVAYLLN